MLPIAITWSKYFFLMLQLRNDSVKKVLFDAVSPMFYHNYFIIMKNIQNLIFKIQYLSVNFKIASLFRYCKTVSLPHVPQNRKPRLLRTQKKPP